MSQEQMTLGSRCPALYGSKNLRTKIWGTDILGNKCETPGQIDPPSPGIGLKQQVQLVLYIELKAIHTVNFGSEMVEAL